MTTYPERALIGDIALNRVSPAAVQRRFRARLADGVRLHPVGTAKHRPQALLSRGYLPRRQLGIFGLDIYLSGPWQNEDIRFFVAYVLHPLHPRRIIPRLFYKDVSLTWRCASHYVPSQNWIGKGDVKVVMSAGVEQEESDEATTDLPLEIQTALETACKVRGKVPYDRKAVPMVLRNAPAGRLEPYADFLQPRAEALREGKGVVNRGRSIARFTRRNDPTSLRFVSGYQPDFTHGVLSVAKLNSRLYGGELKRFRIASQNRRVQFHCVAAPRHHWIASVQATTTALSTYALRLVDAVVDEALLLPGYEYHFLEYDDDPDSLYSQIPPGFAGDVSQVDSSRADASPWLSQVPILREFRHHFESGTLGRPSPNSENPTPD